jgi:hypothetical protein
MPDIGNAEELVSNEASNDDNGSEESIEAVTK